MAHLAHYLHLAQGSLGLPGSLSCPTTHTSYTCFPSLESRHLPQLYPTPILGCWVPKELIPQRCTAKKWLYRTQTVAPLAFSLFCLLVWFQMVVCLFVYLFVFVIVSLRQGLSIL